MANQLAAVYEAPSPKPIKTNARLSKPEVLPEVHRRRLTNANDLERSLVLICQPGRDELNESILQAIGAGQFSFLIARQLSFPISSQTSDRSTSGSSRRISFCNAME